MTIDLSRLEVWFVVGAQSLYGEGPLGTVADHAREMTNALSSVPGMPVKIVCQPVMVTAESVLEMCLDANRSRNCIGIITWMHTFSPAQMWIPGLRALRKPLAHLHTQFNRDLPWSTIDMDFMNLNQSAHGDREFGFIGSRLRIDRKVIAGYWQDQDVRDQLTTWTRAACAWHDAQTLEDRSLRRQHARSSRDRRRQSSSEGPAGLFGPWLWGGRSCRTRPSGVRS